MSFLDNVDSKILEIDWQQQQRMMGKDFMTAIQGSIASNYSALVECLRLEDGCARKNTQDINIESKSERKFEG